MKITETRRMLPVALGVLALAATTGVAFSAWLDKGAAIFMTYAEAGLAWCF